MSDRVWEELAEPAFDASIWVLKCLYDVLRRIYIKEGNEVSEFNSAAEGVLQLQKTLIAIKGLCYSRRIGD